MEPYVYAQTVAARASFEEGAARNSWLTGTASWTFVNISQYILGIKPTLSGLSIDPCLPTDFGDYTVTRKFRGAVYRISVRQLQPDRGWNGNGGEGHSRHRQDRI